MLIPDIDIPLRIPSILLVTEVPGFYLYICLLLLYTDAVETVLNDREVCSNKDGLFHWKVFQKPFFYPCT